MEKREIEHPRWGKIIVTANHKARRIIMRARPDAIHITVPPFATGQDIERALEKFGERLKQQQSSSVKLIDGSYHAGSGPFRISIEEYNGCKFMWVRNGKAIVLMVPKGTDYTQRQEWLQKVLTDAIASEAKRTLPERLNKLARIHGLSYSGCSVRNMHSRWGSCSGKGSISLNAYLVLLPEELIDYVILHELCHTVELNHGERFWALLDKTCGCDSRQLRKALRGYSPSI